MLKNLWFSDVCRRYKKRPVHGMINKQSKPSCKLGKKGEAKRLEIFNFLKNNRSLYNVIKSTVKEEECCVANSKGNSEWQNKVKVYRLPRNLEEKKDGLLLYLGTIYRTLKTQFCVKNIGLKTTQQTRPWQRNTKRSSFCIYMRLTKPSSNITTTKKKYRESIGRSKEFITWLERSYFRERQNKRLRSSRSQMFFKIGVLYIFYIVFIFFYIFIYLCLYFKWFCLILSK